MKLFAASVAISAAVVHAGPVAPPAPDGPDADAISVMMAGFKMPTLDAPTKNSLHDLFKLGDDPSQLKNRDRFLADCAPKIVKVVDKLEKVFPTKTTDEKGPEMLVVGQQCLQATFLKEVQMTDVCTDLSTHILQTKDAAVEESDKPYAKKFCAGFHNALKRADNSKPKHQKHTKKAALSEKADKDADDDDQDDDDDSDGTDDSLLQEGEDDNTEDAEDGEDEVDDSVHDNSFKFGLSDDQLKIHQLQSLVGENAQYHKMAEDENPGDDGEGIRAHSSFRSINDPNGENVDPEAPEGFLDNDPRLEGRVYADEVDLKQGGEDDAIDAEGN